MCVCVYKFCNLIFRRREDIPLLPNERPVKRPWVADPSLGSRDRIMNTEEGLFRYVFFFKKSNVIHCATLRFCLLVLGLFLFISNFMLCLE